VFISQFELCSEASNKFLKLTQLARLLQLQIAGSFLIFLLLQSQQKVLCV